MEYFLHGGSVYIQSFTYPYPNTGPKMADEIASQHIPPIIFIRFLENVMEKMYYL